MKRATNAKERTERAEVKEQAQLDILAWQSDKISKGEESELNDTIIQGILSGKSYVKTADASSFTTLKGEYIIQYSELYQASDNTGIDWNAAKAKATSPHSEQTQSGDIGIGTDGELVNLDYWMYSIGGDGNIKLGGTVGDYGSGSASDSGSGSASGSGSGSASGSGSTGFSLGYIYDIVDGKIVGKMPQYVKLEGTDEWLPVTDISYCFYGVKYFITAPELPTTLTEIGEYAFGNCDYLSTITIPNSITNIKKGAYFSCPSLNFVNYNGTMEQWNNIVIDNSIDEDSGLDGNGYLLSQAKIICTDGTINE